MARWVVGSILHGGPDCEGSSTQSGRKQCNMDSCPGIVVCDIYVRVMGLRIDP